MFYLYQNNLGPVVLSIKSILIGLGVAYIVYITNYIMTKYSSFKKNKKIKEGKSDIVDLTKRIHQLEIENSKLDKPVDENALWNLYLKYFQRISSYL